MEQVAEDGRREALVFKQPLHLESLHLGQGQGVVVGIEHPPVRAGERPRLQCVPELRASQQQPETRERALTRRRAREAGQRLPQLAPHAGVDVDAGAPEQGRRPLERERALRFRLDVAERLERQRLGLAAKVEERAAHAEHRSPA